MTTPTLEFDRTVDAVDDVGCDPAGETPIDDALEGLSEGTCVEFPSGEYVLDQCRIRASNIGLVAADGATPVIRPARPAAEMAGDWMLLAKDGGDYAIRGFEFDFTREGYGATVNLTVEEGDLHIADIHVRGVYPDGVSGLTTQIVDTAGVGVIERFVTRDGTVYDSGSSGIYVGRLHGGTLYIRDCEIWNRASNAVYASAMGYERDAYERRNGPVHVQGGLYKNNNISNIRLGSTGSSAVGVTIHNDADPHGDTWDSREYAIMPRSGSEDQPVINSRGIWLKNREDILVEDCDIKYDVGNCAGIIDTNTTAGSMTIRDTRIEVNTDEPAAAVYLQPPSIHATAGWTFENVHVTGTGDIPQAMYLDDRDGTTLSECCIDLRDADQDGLCVIDSDDVSVSDTAISVPGTPITTTNATVSEAGVSTTAACESPTVDGARETPTDSPPEFPHTLSIRGTGVATNYVVGIDGEFRGDALERWDTVADDRIEGWVTDAEHVDRIDFDGTITDVTIREGEAVFSLDGDRVTVGQLTTDDEADGSGSDGSDESDTQPTQTLTVHNESAGGVAYRFDVDGEVVAWPASADVYPARGGAGVTRVAASSQTGWSQEFRIRGAVVARDVPDGMRFESEP